MYEAIFLAHLFSTLFMMGLIWFVQVVHYPLHRYVGEQEFNKYQSKHVERTGYVVGIPMLIEISTSVYFLFDPIPGISPNLFVLGLVLLMISWLSTALLQVPCHNALQKNFSVAVHSRLVNGNWIRTFAWSSRGILVLYLTSMLL
jgi:hypothetical protein